MIDSSFKRYLCSVSMPLFALSLFLTTIFIASCGDEGDTVEEDTSTVTGVLQPPTTSPDTQGGDPVVVDPPPVAVPVVPEEPIVSFQADIQPILAERCATPGCHAVPGAAGLDLNEYDTFKKGGKKKKKNGPGFIAGDGKGSLVVKRIDGGGMPPIPPPLDKDQIQLFIDWIDAGAENN